MRALLRTREMKKEEAEEEEEEETLPPASRVAGGLRRMEPEVGR